MVQPLSTAMEIVRTISSLMIRANVIGMAIPSLSFQRYRKDEAVAVEETNLWELDGEKG